MTKVLIAILLVFSLSIPVAAEEITAPEVPPSGRAMMPQNQNSFAEALWELIQKSIQRLQPELTEAVQISSGILSSALLISLLAILSEKITVPVTVAGTASISAMILQHAGAMVGYASDTVWEICEYGKLLCPVLTTALAAQGGITTAAVLYAGTTAINALISMLVSRCFVPMIYLFLAFSIANCALGEDFLKKFSDAIKIILNWLLKTLLIAFTTYMSVTGVVSGTTDAATLKAARLTISTVVPVVGGILSDASESVLVSMGVMKNAAGVYGILALLAVFIGPFIKIGIQYLLLKISALLCSLFSYKPITALIEDFSTAMGLLLAMVAVSCILFLISTVCFMKGLG